MIFRMPMAMRNRVILFLLCNLFWLLLSSKTCYGAESDINCLRTLKAQLEDPCNYLCILTVFDDTTEGFICKFRGIECWHPDENKVLNISLLSMGLRGQFPSGLKNCTSITGLHLFDNDLSGSLPGDIDEIIPYVVTLDLSSNNFSGNLTSKLGNLTYLNALNLQHNQFSGPIPSQIGRLARLTAIDVADNSLSWPIPTFTNKSFGAESFANNNRLYGKPLVAKPGGPPRKSHVGGVIISCAAVGGICNNSHCSCFC